MGCAALLNVKPTRGVEEEPPARAEPRRVRWRVQVFANATLHHPSSILDDESIES